jgi:hypothetical protein
VGALNQLKQNSTKCMFDCIMLEPLSTATHGTEHGRFGHTSCHGAHVVKNDIKGEHIFRTNLNEAKLKSL